MSIHLIDNCWVVFTGLEDNCWVVFTGLEDNCHLMYAFHLFVKRYFLFHLSHLQTAHYYLLLHAFEQFTPFSCLTTVIKY